MITEEELGKGLLTLKMIWFAMLASLAVYLFLGIQVAANVQASMDKDTFAILKAVLYAVALITLIVTRYARKFVLAGKGQSGQPTQTAQHPALQKYFTATIVALALSESVGIYGLVLFFLGKNPIDLYLLILIAAAAMIMYRPRKDELISLSRDALTNSATAGTTG